MGVKNLNTSNTQFIKNDGLMYNFYQLTNFYEYSVYDLKIEISIDIYRYYQWPNNKTENQSQG